MDLSEQLRLLLEEFEGLECPNVHKHHQIGAANLIDYYVFRSKSRSGLHAELGQLGLSGFRDIESNVKGVIENNISLIDAISGESTHRPLAGLKHVGRSDLANALLGYPSDHLKTSIMVTMSSDMIRNPDLIRDLIDTGMNIARINCAHDSPEEWLEIIKVIREHEKHSSKSVRIFMDLAGPKIRTGNILTADPVIKLKPLRDREGQVVDTDLIVLGQLNGRARLSLSDDIMSSLQSEDEMTFKDRRGKKRKLKVKVDGNQVVLSGDKTVYIGLDTVFKKGQTTFSPTSISVDEFVVLKVGDHVRLKYADDLVDDSAEIPCIPCTSKLIIDNAKKGDRIFFDDGKISGRVFEIDSDSIAIKIEQAGINGTKLRSDKGINLPDTNLGFKGLTHKDLVDLKFVVNHADVVNFSFVNTKEDVQFLNDKLEELNASEDFGVVYKIETKQAFAELKNILLTGMKRKVMGVMIARGDLAIEVGWDKMVSISREIGSICKAAGVPVIWATQVLDGMSKAGVPSRSEIMDAAISSRTDCVMLNKGAYILQSMELLKKIISNFEDQGIEAGLVSRLTL